MATPPLRSPLIAVDTNVPLDLAGEKEHALDAFWQIIANCQLACVLTMLPPGRMDVKITVGVGLSLSASFVPFGKARPGEGCRSTILWLWLYLHKSPVGKA